MIEIFLSGVIAAFSLVAAVFFFRFWRDTRDKFFLAFTTFFLIETGNRVALLFFAKPNEGSPWIYILRLFALIIILAAILKKNYGNAK